MPKISDIFAARLRALRTQAGLSLYALAPKCGLTRQHLSMLERGERKPSLEVAQQIAQALGRRLECWE